MIEKNIEAKKFKVCLEYHIGNCLGPCEGLQTEENYEIGISHIKTILKGNVGVVLKQLTAMLQEYVVVMQFEKAQELKERIKALENYQSKSTVVSATITNIDVFSIQSDEKSAYVNFFKVIDGAIVQGHTIEMKKRLDESDDDLLQMAVVELRIRFQSISPEVIVPFIPSVEIPGVEFTVPKIGDKKHLLELSVRNVGYYRKDKASRELLVDPDRHKKEFLRP